MKLNLGVTSLNQLLIALGGNAILQAGQRGTHEEQLLNIRSSCKKLADLCCRGYTMVITHGNGPQVGNLVIQNEQASGTVPTQPLHSLVAQTQGQIGYMIQCALENEARRKGRRISTSCLITRVLVDENDPAFKNPTKPIGPFFPEEFAKKRMLEGESWFKDGNRGWRRIVPSPHPVRILDVDNIKDSLDDHEVVIAAGGGGIPVIEKENEIVGIEAVIDKDLASSLLARQLGIDTLVILTDVANVKLNFGQPDEQDLRSLTLDEAERYLSQGQFGVGSMAPKVQAAVEFVRAGGQRAIITSLTEVLNALEGKAGTVIKP
jgi:carbamate kinase